VSWRGALALLVALGLGAPLAGGPLLPAPARAQDTGSSDEVRAEWQERYRDLIEQERRASERLEAARTAYADGRQRKRLRGERKLEVMEELDNAEADHQKARDELEAFPEEARRAGIPPGWLREVEN
jgi:hypothetical protein